MEAANYLWGVTASLLRAWTRATSATSWPSYHQRVWVRPGSVKAEEVADEPMVPFDVDEDYLTQIKPFE